MRLLTEAQYEAKIARLQRRERRRAWVRRHAHWLVFTAFLVLSVWASVAHAQTPVTDTATVRVARTTAVIYIVDLTPSPDYRRWYHQMERCVGLTGEYGAVKWFLTADAWTSGSQGGRTLAGWQRPHRITVSAAYRADSTIIMHESLHDILSYNGMDDDDHPHPMPYFDGRCAKPGYP